MDDHSSSENNSNGDEDRTCSDSDLLVPLTDTKRKYKESSILDQSNSDCFKTYLSLSSIIKDANIRNSSNSDKQVILLLITKIHLIKLTIKKII